MEGIACNSPNTLHPTPQRDEPSFFFLNFVQHSNVAYSLLNIGSGWERGTQGIIKNLPYPEAEDISHRSTTFLNAKGEYN